MSRARYRLLSILVFLLSLGLPALYLDKVMWGWQAAGLSGLGVWMMLTGAPATVSLQLGACIACTLGLAANVTFLIGHALAWLRSKDPGTIARSSLVLGGLATLTLLLFGAFPLVLPGWFAWMASFELLRRSGLPEPEPVSPPVALGAWWGAKSLTTPATSTAVQRRSPARVRVCSAKSGDRCGYCHAGDPGPSRSCPGCRVVLHDECWFKVSRCPTLGCEVKVRSAGQAGEPSGR